MPGLMAKSVGSSSDPIATIMHQVPEETGRHPGYQIEGNGTGYLLKRGDWRCRL
jgi:hypothetical protein